MASVFDVLRAELFPIKKEADESLLYKTLNELLPSNLSHLKESIFDELLDYANDRGLISIGDNDPYQSTVEIIIKRFNYYQEFSLTPLPRSQVVQPYLSQ